MILWNIHASGRLPERSEVVDVIDDDSVVAWSMSEAIHYAIVFLVITLVAAPFGSGGVAGVAMPGA